MTNIPDPASSGPTHLQQVPWWWQRLDADGLVMPEEDRQDFPTRSDAETWLGEAYPDLSEDGVCAVTLFEGDREVYGPMSLEAT